MFTRILIGFFVVLIGLWLYVRFAPTDAGRWHDVPEVNAPEDRLEEGGFLAVRKMTAPASDVLDAIVLVADATDRTTLIAGSPDEGMLTFQTRSQVWGFPDHTSVAVQGDLLVIYGRLRFGRSDLGVNKARIDRWLATLGPLIEPL